MKGEIYNYLEKFEEQTKERFCILHGLIYESTSQKIDERLWAKLPSFYVDDNVVRLIIKRIYTKNYAQNLHYLFRKII